MNSASSIPDGAFSFLGNRYSHFDLCRRMSWGFLEMRVWVGVWTAFFLLVIVATDASVVVGLITRFTEEAFATLISIIFIIQAFEKVFSISKEAPLTLDPMVGRLDLFGVILFRIGGGIGARDGIQTPESALLPQV